MKSVVASLILLISGISSAALPPCRMTVWQPGAPSETWIPLTEVRLPDGPHLEGDMITRGADGAFYTYRTMADFSGLPKNKRPTRITIWRVAQPHDIALAHGDGRLPRGFNTQVFDPQTSVTVQTKCN